MCRAIVEGGRRCNCRGEARNRVDRARRLLVRVGAAGAVLEHEVIVEAPVWVAPIESAAAVASVEEASYGGCEEYDLDGELMEKEAAAAAPAAIAVPHESLYVTSVAEVREALAERGSLTAVAVYSRTATGELIPRAEHPELHRTRQVTGVWEHEYGLDDGGAFAVGRPQHWTFADGLGTFESAAGAVTYRFAGPPAGVVASFIPTAAGLAQVRSEVDGMLSAFDARLDDLRRSDPAGALDLLSRNGDLLDSARNLDVTAMGSFRLSEAQWHSRRDAEHPELLVAEQAINETAAAKLHAGLTFTQDRFARLQRSGQSTAGIQDHLDALRGAIRGLSAEKKILQSRAARVGTSA